MVSAATEAADGEVLSSVLVCSSSSVIVMLAKDELVAPV